MTQIDKDQPRVDENLPRSEGINPDWYLTTSNWKTQNADPRMEKISDHPPSGSGRITRCMCRACGQFFNSTSMFDRHLGGTPQKRKCRTPQWMLDKGHSLNKHGFWIREEYKGHPVGPIRQNTNSS